MKPWPVTFACLVLLGCVLEPATVHKNKPDSTPAQTETELEENLRKAADHLLETIRKKDREKLLALFSRSGAEIGADNRVSYKAIQSDLEEKGPIYCEFFDTPCLRKHLEKSKFKPAQGIHGQEPWPVSYRDVLNTVSGLQVSTRLHKDSSGVIWGQVTVKWQSPPPRDLGVSFLTFAFELEADEWKLVSDGGPY